MFLFLWGGRLLLAWQVKSSEEEWVIITLDLEHLSHPFPAFYPTYPLFADPVWLIERLSLYASSSFWWSLSLQHLALLWLWQKDFNESEAGVTSSADNWFPVELQIWWDGNPLSQGERLRIQLETILRYSHNQSSEDFHSVCRFSAPTKKQVNAGILRFVS